jgi:valyl-tRNA synthetase
MSDIPKTYDPSAVEPAWYQRWCDAGCFTATIPSDAGTAAPHAIMMPPPNVTGVLHMGHLLDNTIPDILTRRARQEGRPALWLPGTDHAGIATQSRVEKELRKAGKTRHDLGRERFIAAAAEWRDRHGGIILEQLKKLGASCDWSRRAHTLDAGYSRAVLNAFVTLYHRRGPDGRPYIYRGRRMVNWCPVSLTGLSDEEVIMKPQKGVFYRMRYEVADAADLPPEKRFVEIGTTRPETIPGDTAVAVHPDDLLDGARYAHLRGRSVWRPFPRAKIPVVADAHVERDFGSGVLKVTPAHDKADFEIGRRHDLPVIDVMNPDGTLNALAGDGLAGLDRFKARTAAAAKLRDLGLLLKEEPYENNVGFSERADVPIEPRLSEQWFIRYPKVPEALRAVESGAVKFHPERWVKTYNNWLNNIQDWCISRQLWWGHRIPVWYRKGADRDDPANRHVALEPPADPENWEQDNDVLDTWASSWLWCLATLGWEKPGDEKRPELADLRFWYPTASLTTGPDIIFLWVARMIIAGLEFYGDERPQLRTATGAFDDAEIARRIPFRDVYFHGIIRDEKGRKMSKSLGNSPEPLDLFAKYGADGVRFGLLSIAPKGQDILFSEDRISQGRNFCNKLWNAARFRQMQETPPATTAAAVPAMPTETVPAAPADRPEALSQIDRAAAARMVAERGTEFINIVTSPDRVPSLKQADAEKWARENLREKAFPNDDTGKEFFVSGGGIEKMLMGGKAFAQARIAAIYQLPVLIKEAKGLQTPDPDNDVNLKAKFHLYVPFRWQGAVYRLRLIAREFHNQELPAVHSYRVEDIIFEDTKKPASGVKAHGQSRVAVTQSGSQVFLNDTVPADGAGVKLQSLPENEQKEKPASGVARPALERADDTQSGSQVSALTIAELFRQSENEPTAGDAGTTSPLPAPRSPLPAANSLLPAAATDDDHAILAALADATDTIAAALRDFDFNTYTATLYQFFWTDYCDRYVEASKPRLQDPDPAVRAHTLAVQDICLRQFLLLLHPITPFITEELAHRLNYVADGEYIQNIAPATGTAIRDALAAAGLALDPARAAAANAQNEFITAARALKAQQNQAAKKDARFHLEPKDPAAAALLTANLEKLRKLIGAAEIALVNGEQGTGNGEQGDSAAAGGVPTAATPTPLGTLHLELATAGDLDTAAERERLTRDLEKLEKQAVAGEAKLANPAFLAKAPPAILDGARAQLAATVAKRDEIRRLLAALG